ncbi:MAG: glycosyltransferase family 2 protein [Deltaproteobacteria bacterium]|nr:glycosyltransferase family 2 protein [Deltaproteobacteria bacterium]
MGPNLKIEAITVWFNEQFLAKYFLDHYRFVDKIHLVLDTDTNDDTLSIVSRYPNVALEEITFPNTFDDVLKIERINSVYSKLDCDWVISADSDEFVFPLPFGTGMREALANEAGYDVVRARMWQVYRHRTDSDLDPDKPAVPQRRHGDPNVTAGVNALYTKPMIVKGGQEMEWKPGCHLLEKQGNKAVRVWERLFGGKKVSPNLIHGVHWQRADPELIGYRIANRKNRLSERNVRSAMSLQFRLEEEEVLKECEVFLDAPQLF